MSAPHNFEQFAVEHMWCPYCDSEPGEWCRVRATAERAQQTHFERARVLYDVWRDGYDSGRRASA